MFSHLTRHPKSPTCQDDISLPFLGTRSRGVLFGWLCSKFLNSQTENSETCPQGFEETQVRGHRSFLPTAIVEVRVGASSQQQQNQNITMLQLCPRPATSATQTNTGPCIMSATSIYITWEILSPKASHSKLQMPHLTWAAWGTSLFLLQD